jgi:hypothetical protein
MLYDMNAMYSEAMRRPICCGISIIRRRENGFKGEVYGKERSTNALLILQVATHVFMEWLIYKFVALCLVSRFQTRN